MMSIDEEMIEEWRKERGNGMVSAVGEYTPEEFWLALDEIEKLRGVIRDLLDQIDCKDGTAQINVSRAMGAIERYGA